MKSCEGQIGRVFVIRLEHGDIVPTCIERFAKENKISVGHVIMVGGIDSGEVVVGPRNSREMPPQPLLLPVDTHGQSPWHFTVQALLDTLQVISHSPTGKTRGTLPCGLLLDS